MVVESWKNKSTTGIQTYIFDSELPSHVRFDHPVSSLMSSLTKRLHCWKGVNDEVTGKFILKHH